MDNFCSVCDRYQKRTTFPTFLAYAHIATWLCMTTRGHARPTGNGGSAVRCDYWFATSTLRPRIVRAENWRTFTPPPRRSVSRFPFSLLALSCPARDPCGEPSNEGIPPLIRGATRSAEAQRTLMHVVTFPFVTPIRQMQAAASLTAL